MLLHVMGYVFGGTLAHLQSCISRGRVAAFPVVEGAVAAEVAGAVPAAKRAKVGDSTGGGGPMQEPTQHGQDQLPPKLALVSHALALAATPAPHLVSLSSAAVLGVGVRLVLAWLVAAAEAAEGGCEWLQAYCDFLQKRHRLG
jgi:hypothetical protein